MNKRSSLSEAMQQVSADRGGKRAGVTAEEGERKKLTIYLDATMHRGLRQLAVDRDSNINAIVVKLIAAELRGARP